MSGKIVSLTMNDFRAHADREIQFEPGINVLVGLNGCLRGDTKIYDPVDRSNLTVKERRLRGTPFHVYASSPSGRKVVAGALPPCLYPKTPMARVKTDHGVFCATWQHRVRVEDGGYLSLRDALSLLQRGAEVRLLTTSGICQPGSSSDVEHCWQTTEDFQDGCPVYRRCDDEQPPLGEVTFRWLFPSLTDVQERNRRISREDGPVVKLGCTHRHPQSALLSMIRCLLRSLRSLCLLFPSASVILQRICLNAVHKLLQCRAWTSLTGTWQTLCHLLKKVWPSSSWTLDYGYAVECLCDVKNSGRRLRTCQTELRCQQAYTPSSTVPLFDRLLQGELVSPLPLVNSVDRPDTVSNKIHTIEPVEEEEYYDFHVPLYENYWAEGCFHHNSGKSTVLKAIRWVVFNRPLGDSVLRWGKKACSVSLLTDSHRVDRIKGAENLYKLDGREFRAVRFDVPLEVQQALRLDLINFQGQPDPPFWLSLSPPDAAREMNRVIDLEVIDRSMTYASSKVKDSGGKVKTLTEMLEQARVKVGRLRWLEDAEAKAKRAFKLEQDAEAKRTRAVSIKRLLSQLTEAREEVGTVTDLSEVTPVVNKLRAVRQRLGELRRLTVQLKRERAELCEIEKTLTTLRKQAEQLRPETCSKCGQVIPKSPTS